MKLVGQEKIYRRNETKLHRAPQMIIYLSGLITVVFFFGMIGGLFGLFVQNQTFCYTCGICIGIALVYGFFADHFYNYQENLQYRILGSTFEIKYGLNNQVIPSANTTVSIFCDGIYLIKTKKNKIVIGGVIQEKRPLRAERTLKKIEITLKHFSKEEQEEIRTFFQQFSQI